MHFRRGFFLPLVILGVLSMVFLITFVNSLGSSFTHQVQHVDEVSRTYVIGEAVFAQVTARIREKPYSQRFFAGVAYEEYERKILGGDYDLFIEDAREDGKLLKNIADIYVRARYGNVKRLYFWRVRVEDSLLDAAGKMYFLLFANLDPEKFPKPGASPFADQIKEILAKRKANSPVSGVKGAAVLGANSVPQILDILKGNPPGQTSSVPAPLPSAPLPNVGAALPPAPSDPLPSVPAEWPEPPLMTAKAIMEGRPKIVRNPNPPPSVIPDPNGRPDIIWVAEQNFISNVSLDDEGTLLGILQNWTFYTPEKPSEFKPDVPHKEELEYPNMQHGPNGSPDYRMVVRLLRSKGILDYGK